MSTKPKYNNQQEHLEDILKLSRGIRTSRRIGSRSVPHRLNRQEQQDFTRALERGWLSCNGLRTALWNTYREYQHAQGLVAIIHEKTPYQDRLYLLLPPDQTQQLVEFRVQNPLPQYNWPMEPLDWGWCWYQIPRNQVRLAIEQLQVLDFTPGNEPSPTD
jgi:hypothetical protein